MRFCEMANQIGVTEYPELFDRIYKNIALDTPACDLELIDRLEKKYNLFGDYYSVLRETAQQVNADPIYSIWVKVASEYCLNHCPTVVPAVPDAARTGTAVTDLLLFYIILPRIPHSIDKYLSRGFEEEEINKLLKVYSSSIRASHNYIGRPALSLGYFRWMSHFAMGTIFETDGFQFDIKQLPDQATWLKNKQTGQIVPLVHSGTFHASGKCIAGTRGYKETEGAFTVTYTEDDENYYGHGVYDSVVNATGEVFSKALWEKVGAAGDVCLYIHIPNCADISRDTTMKACLNAKKIMQQKFPEYNAKLIYTSSWILNPMLKQMLGESAKIPQFLDCFIKYPSRDANGASVLSFVFDKKYENYADLPENTSLQRKLKQLYLDGGCLHSYSGAIYIGEESL